MFNVKQASLFSSVIEDDATDYIKKSFDLDFDGTSEFKTHNKPSTPKNFSLGVIYGSSGSGKSTLLKEYGEEEEICWETDKAIISHFDSPEDGVNSLSAAGLNSIPVMVKPYHVLSTGEKFRADLARRLGNNCVIDEFTSVINREVAKSASVSLRKTIDRDEIKGVVLATCHSDIIEWIEPDWTYNTDTGEMLVGRSLRRRPEIKLDIFKCDKRLWEIFKKHHYLSDSLNPSAVCYAGTFNGVLIAFNASISLPSRIPPLYEGDTRNKYRESRTVVLPDYQGLGIGTRFSDAIADHYVENLNYRYFSKTSHIRMGGYREKSDLWRPTSTNLKSRAKSQKCAKTEAWHHMMLDTKRICFSHEYIGKSGSKHKELYLESINDNPK